MKFFPRKTEKEKEFSRQFGLEVKLNRKKKKLGHRTLGIIIDFSSSRIRDIESGAVMPSDDTVSIFERALGFKFVFDLIEFEKESSKPARHGETKSIDKLTKGAWIK